MAQQERLGADHLERPKLELLGVLDPCACLSEHGRHLRCHDDLDRAIFFSRADVDYYELVLAVRALSRVGEDVTIRIGAVAHPARG